MTDEIIRPRPIVLCPLTDSRVEKSHRKRVDINTIVAKAKKSGYMPQTATPARYGDFSEVIDYHTCKQAQIDCETAFNSLPSQIRKRFKNDPGKLLDFLADETNYKEAADLGIIEKIDYVDTEEPSVPSGEEPAPE